MYFYRKVYPKSWHIIKGNFPILFFGLFASILGFYELRILFDLNNSSPDFLGSTIIFWTKLFRIFTTTDISFSSLPTLLGFMGFFMLMAIMIILAVSSQGALIASTAPTNNKQNFKKLMQIGIDKFWPLLGLSIINTLIGYFFVAFIINPMIYFTATNNNWLLYFLLGVIIFMVLLPLIIIISFVTRYGSAYIVLKNQKLLTAFTNSWYLFKVNWLITIENAIFLSTITLLFFLALFTALVFTFTPFLILSTFITFSQSIFLLVIIIGGLISVIIFILGTSLFGAYYNLVWANVFIELTAKGKSHSKIYRLVNKHLPAMTK